MDFLINVPIGLITALIGAKLIDTDKVKNKTSFDLIGFIEIALSSGIILVGTEIATHGKDYWLSALGLVILGIILGFIVFRHLKNQMIHYFHLIH